MVFRLNKSLMSLCPFTKILASPITPFFDGLEKFRRVVSSFGKASPQGDPFPPLMLQMPRKWKVWLMKTVDFRAMSLNLSQESRKQLSMAYWLVIWGSEISIPSGSHTSFQKAIKQQEYWPVQSSGSCLWSKEWITWLLATSLKTSLGFSGIYKKKNECRYRKRP